MPKRQKAAGTAANGKAADERGELLVQHLQKMFSDVADEPIPDDLLSLLKQLDSGQKAPSR